MSKVAVVITQLRTAQKWSQSELARRSGLRQTHISQIESGELSNPSLLTLEKLATAFEMPSHELVRRINESAAQAAA